MFISRKDYEELVREKEEKEKLVEENKKLSKEKRLRDVIIAEKDAQVTSLQALLDEATKINQAKANDNGCMIGEWCKECRHGKIMNDTRSVWVREGDIYASLGSGSRYINNDLGYYCTKHMTEICPEFELPKN